jgi:hypothetical protein
MALARARYIPSLLQVHLDDLAFIAGQRRAALSSRKHTLREFGELSERLEAHLQGALVAPPEVLAAQLQPQLAAEDRDEAFAAAYVLLRLAEAHSTHLVVVEFSRARGDTLAGLRDALSLAPPKLFADELRSALERAKASTAVTAAVALANHRLLDANAPRLAKLLEDEDEQVCALAWQAALLVDAAAPQKAPLRPFKVGVLHASATVRMGAWHAVAWAAGQANALALLRQRAAGGDAVALHWLAVLGTGDDAAWLQKTAQEMPSAHARCALLARHGHPAALPLLLPWMAPEDVALAAAAGEAYTRITGQDVRGERRSLPVAGDADEFERDMAPEVWLPDAKLAQATLERHGNTWAAGLRWCQGRCLDAPLAREVVAQLDLEARWDAAARSALSGRMISAPPPIH